MSGLQELLGLACAMVGFGFLAFLSIGMIYVAAHEEDLPDDLIQ